MQIWDFVFRFLTLLSAFDTAISSHNPHMGNKNVSVFNLLLQCPLCGSAALESETPGYHMPMPMRLIQS
jgi:hypothetical protein